MEDKNVNEKIDDYINDYKIEIARLTEQYNDDLNDHKDQFDSDIADLVSDFQEELDFLTDEYKESIELLVEEAETDYDKGDQQYIQLFPNLDYDEQDSKKPDWRRGFFEDEPIKTKNSSWMTFGLWCWCIGIVVLAAIVIAFGIFGNLLV
jgi:hypothetical protein